MKNVLILILGVLVTLIMTFPIWYFPVHIIVCLILKKDYGYDIPKSAYDLNVPSKKMSSVYLETEKGFVDKDGYFPENMKNVIAIYIGIGGFSSSFSSGVRLYKKVPIQDIKEMEISPLGAGGQGMEDLLLKNEISDGLSGPVSIVTDKKTYKFKNLLDTMNSNTEFSFFDELDRKFKIGEITKEEEAYEFAKMRYKNSCLHALRDVVLGDDVADYEENVDAKEVDDSFYEQKDLDSTANSSLADTSDNNLIIDNAKVSVEGQTCRTCGTLLRVGSSYCHECGQSVSGPWLCFNCGCELPNGSKYCLSCGTLVGPEIYKKIDFKNPRKITNISEELKLDDYDS